MQSRGAPGAQGGRWPGEDQCRPPVGPARPTGRLAALVSGALFAAPAHAAAVEALPWPAAALVLALVTALAATAGALWTRRRSERELFAARQTVRALEQLVGACRWRTDALHRLEGMVPDAGADVLAGADAARRQPLWDWLEAADRSDPDLRQRLQGEGPVGPMAVCLRTPGAAAAAAARWTLRAVPRVDANGRFAGHDGTLAPLADGPAVHLERAALDALWQRLPGPAWLAVRDRHADDWRVERAGEAARALAGDTLPATWTQLLAALPAEVRQAVQRLETAGGSSTAGPWQIHLSQLEADGLEARLLALWPAAPAADDGALAEQQSVSFAVSHDLRAPLRVVEGFTRILKEDYGRQLDRIGNDHLDRVLGACARMGHMIDALLALARLSSQPLARQPVDLSQLAGYVVDDLRRQFPTPPADLTIEPGLTVQGDPTLLRMLLENLLGNAWKYSARCERRRIAFEHAEQDGRRVFVVRDNGAGFDMRFADRLFGIFQRLHSASDFQGTGVGLASVRRIVHRHGGQIWAEGEVGRGARFYFTLDG
jgi:signal transduction histidine kinase